MAAARTARIPTVPETLLKAAALLGIGDEVPVEVGV
jgi:hypothetical protein